MSSLWDEVRVGARTLAKQRGFSVVTVVTLALGIGANTAIFTLVHAVMLKTLPVERPQELYRLGDDDNCCVISGLQDSFSLFSHPLYQQLRDHTPEFRHLAAFAPFPIDLSVRRAGGSDLADAFRGELVSGNYFSMFGVRPFKGRLLTAGDDAPGAALVAVVNHRSWNVRYGGDPSLVGSAVWINGHPVTIVGIAQPDFFGDTVRSDPPDVWLPLGSEPALRGQSSLLNQPDSFWLYAIGRLDQSAEPQQVQARLTTELRTFLATLDSVPANQKNQIGRQHIVLARAGGGVEILRINYAAALRVLFVVSGLVLLIACANVANLMLARVNLAQTAVRAALGAARGRLVGQALTESALLAVAGGVVGVVVAFAATRAILALVFPDATYVPIDPRPAAPVLAFALVLSVLTGLIFGAAPAAMMSNANPADALHGVGRSTRDRALFPRHVLVVAQAALSLMLLVGAGLLTRSLRNLEHQAFGYKTEGLVMARVDPLLAGFAPARLESLYQQLPERLGRIPGVSSVSFSLYGPMSGNNWASGISIEGRPVDPEHRDSASWNRVSGRYFTTIGARLVRGRFIDDRDTPGSHHVTVVNESFAARFFSTGDAIGRHLGLGDAPHAGDYEIVGIVEDGKYQSAELAARPTFFLPLLQNVAYDDPSSVSMQTRSSYIHDVQLRIAGRPERLEADLRRALAEIDPNLTVLTVRTFQERLRQSVGEERLIARLTSLYGLLALLLASVGLYGVTAYAVTRRTSEIGIRMALGARRSNVIAMVIRRALTQVGVGLAIGLPLTIAAARLLSSQLYGIGAHDPATLLAASIALVAAGVGAALVPARRAASIDPMVALRSE